jgi:hypothetical protein
LAGDKRKRNFQVGQGTVKEEAMESEDDETGGSDVTYGTASAPTANLLMFIGPISISKAKVAV